MPNISEKNSEKTLQDFKAAASIILVFKVQYIIMQSVSL